jgi:hypothetical protein
MNIRQAMRTLAQVSLKFFGCSLIASTNSVLFTSLVSHHLNLLRAMGGKGQKLHLRTLDSYLPIF